MLTLLTLIAVAVGGLPGTPPEEPFINATVRIVHSGRRVASSDEGNVAVRVRPGVYRVEAEEGTLITNIPRVCGSQTVRMRSHHKVTIRIRCPIA